LRDAELTDEDVAALRGFMTPLSNFSWLLPGVAGSAQPHGAEGIVALRKAGVRRVISLTPEPLASELVAGSGLEVLYLPVADFTPPTQAQLREAVAAIEDATREGHPIAVHCTAGWGRTGTVLAAFLVAGGADAEAAIAEVRRRRRHSIETPEQEAAVRAYASERRGGP
jgi:atypical dual specificity phosphatase